jgi:hypothetical protein
MNPDRNPTDQIRQTVEPSGDAVADLHLWRIGPGHLAAATAAFAAGSDLTRWAWACAPAASSMAGIASAATVRVRGEWIFLNASFGCLLRKGGLNRA